MIRKSVEKRLRWIFLSWTHLESIPIAYDSRGYDHLSSLFAFNLKESPIPVVGPHAHPNTLTYLYNKKV